MGREGVKLAEEWLKSKQEDLQVPEAITHVVSNRGKKKWTPGLFYFRS